MVLPKQPLLSGLKATHDMMVANFRLSEEIIQKLWTTYGAIACTKDLAAFAIRANWIQVNWYVIIVIDGRRDTWDSKNLNQS